MKDLIKIAITLFLFPIVVVGQTLNLGILNSFEAFTGSGAVTNGNGGELNGDIGTHLGIISGFSSPPYTGNTYNANGVTDDARKDMLRLYVHLNDKFVDFPSTHGPAFVGTLSPGVYSTDGAGSLGAALILDGGGDPNAFFIIKFNGALTVGAGASVTLINGAQSCNVFYIANGAFSVAANVNIKGTLFSKVGAISLGVNDVLEGRMLTMAGTISIGVNSVASAPLCTSTIPIFCEMEFFPALAVDVLGVLSDFALFTSVGAISNTGLSGVNGKIGTLAGAISGYTSGIHIQDEHIADALTTQAALDLDAAYIALMALPNTIPSDPGILPEVLLPHSPDFGFGETITAGVYFINGAGSLGGTLTLDAEGDTNAIFVFKFAGAFGAAALSKMILVNGAKRCNIFWIGGAGVATGAISIGAFSVMKGTFISHGGACNSGAGVFLSGRQLSTAGAVNTNTGVIYNNPECITSLDLPIELISFTAIEDGLRVQLDWITASEINNDYFTIKRSNDGINWENIAEIDGAGYSASILNYKTVDYNPYFGLSYYLLVQTDFDGNDTYSEIRAININVKKADIRIYPNPNNGKITIEGDGEELKSLKIFNVLGQDLTQLVEIINVKETMKILDITKLSHGIYTITTITTKSTAIAANRSNN